MTDPAKDPWKARHEIAESLRMLATTIEGVGINEDKFHFSDDKSYRPRVIRSLRTMEKMVNSFITAIHQLLLWDRR
jgi:hypothetical protein